MPFLFQRVDLPGARTGGLPPFGGSPSRGARIFAKKIKQTTLSDESEEQDDSDTQKKKRILLVLRATAPKFCF